MRMQGNSIISRSAKIGLASPAQRSTALHRICSSFIRCIRRHRCDPPEVECERNRRPRPRPPSSSHTDLIHQRHHFRLNSASELGPLEASGMWLRRSRRRVPTPLCSPTPTRFVPRLKLSFDAKSFALHGSDLERVAERRKKLTLKRCRAMRVRRPRSPGRFALPHSL